MEGSFQRSAEARQHHSELRRTRQGGRKYSDYSSSIATTYKYFITSEIQHVACRLITNRMYFKYEIFVLIMQNGSFQQWWKVTKYIYLST